LSLCRGIGETEVQGLIGVRNLKQIQLYSWASVAVALCLCSLPAGASVLFSDLGTGANVYNENVEFDLAGSASVYGIINSNPNPESSTFADLFTVNGSGSFEVSEIDLAVSNIAGSADTFFASIWTDNSGVPGTEIPGAFWDLVTTTDSQTCCSLVAITGITGIALIGGQEYFMVLGPQSDSDDSWNGWNENTLGATGLTLQSTDGSTWTNLGANSPFGAFQISTPEPGSWLMLGLGAVGLIARSRYSRGKMR
jgi:hypothetical protein